MIITDEIDDVIYDYMDKHKHDIIHMCNLDIVMHEILEQVNPWHTGTPTEEGWYLLLYKSIGGELIPETKHFNFIKHIIETRPDVFMDIYPLWQKLELPTKADIEKISPFEASKENT